VTTFGEYSSEYRIRLAEKAGQVSGEVLYDPGRAFVEAGARNGDSVHFIVSGPQIYTARLESPCLMVGVVDVVDYYQARFVAVR
jgi:hypothetical protein